MQVDLLGRVRNTSLPHSKALLPLFEAVVNAVHGIEELGASNGTIKIQLRRGPTQLSLYGEEQPGPVESILVEDNGIGFTEENFASFNTSDTTRKMEKGGRGIGRLLWLKAFDKVQVESVFLGDGTYRYRRFDFTLSDTGIGNHREQRAREPQRRTLVKLLSLKEPYQARCPPDALTVALKVIDHCLVYFLAADCPEITLFDGDHALLLNKIFRQKISSQAETGRFQVKGRDFEITHLKLYASEESRHRICYCAHGREVTAESVASAIPDLSRKLKDEGGESFVAASYVSGELLDDSVVADRSGFALPEVASDLFPDEISRSDLRAAAVAQVEEFLSGYLSDLSLDKKARVEHFILESAPQYGPLLLHRREDLEALPANLAGDRLEAELHRLRRELEAALRAAGEDLLSEDGDDEHRRRCREHLEEAGRLAGARLFEYLEDRQRVAELLLARLEQPASEDENAFWQGLLASWLKDDADQTTGDPREAAARGRDLLAELLGRLTGSKGSAPKQRDDQE